jgi:type IV pilus assembly protein PilE
MQHPVSKSAGFTLIEIMVAVAILAIITAVAFPAYQAQGLKSKRADGIAMLMDVAGKQERYMVDHSAYTSDMTLLGYAASPVASQKGYYNVSAVLSNGNLSYTLTATAQANQAADVCGNLILSSTGQRSWSNSTATNCW